MEIIYKKIDELHGYDKNARIHGDDQIQQIALSIKNFGFNDPIEIDDTNTILSGHGRLAAAIKLGLSEVPTITHGHMDDDQRKAYILAANRIAMNSTWDNLLLKEEFLTLQDHAFDLSLTGFGDDEIFEILDEHEIVDSKSPDNQKYNSVYEIIIECNDENEQELMFNRFQEEGLKCRILSKSVIV